MSNLLTTQEVAEKLSLTKQTIVEYINGGQLAALKIGQYWRVRPEDLETFINSKRVR